MAGRLAFDIETDGLMNQLTQTWCIAACDIDTKEGWSYGPTDLATGVRRLREADLLIGHNIIAFDLPALWRTTGAWDGCPLILDTLITSRFLWPERPGGHSLEAWGERLGYPKGDFSDWTRFSEEMLEYCQRDVEVTILIKDELEKEHGATLDGFKIYDKRSIHRASRTTDH